MCTGEGIELYLPMPRTCVMSTVFLILDFGW